MRILYISTSIVPSRSANSVHVMKMCAALAELGHEVHLICADNKEEGAVTARDIHDFYGVPHNFELHPLTWGNGRGRSYSYALRLLHFLYTQRLHGKRFDLCIGRFLLGCFLSVTLGYKTIFEMHAPPNRDGIDRWYFERIIGSRNFLRLIVISESLKKTYAHYTTLQNRILVAHDGADADPETSTISWDDASQFHVGYVGHLYRGRGVQLMAAIARRLPWVTMHLVGGTDEDLAYWKDHIQTTPNIIFHGFQEPKHTAKFRRSCDALLAPYEEKVSIGKSMFDTSGWMSPLKIFEYMSAGKPIICSDLPVLHEVLTHNENALLCAPNAIDAWTEAITQLKEDPALAKRIAANARRDLERHYTWKTRAEHILRESMDSSPTP